MKIISDLQQMIKKINLNELFSFSVYKGNYFLGVDISDSSVKLLELGISRQGYEVRAAAVVPLPMDTVVNNEIRDMNGVAEAIKIAIEQGSFSITEAVVALPTPLVMSGVLECEASKSDKEIEEKIWTEAAHIMPYSLEEISFDFSVLGPSKENDGFEEVLYVAARTEEISRREEPLKLAGLDVRVMDVEAYAICRAVKMVGSQLPDAGDNKLIAVVDIGATSTTLTVIDNWNVIFSREEVFGGKHLTLLIQDKYGVSYSEAGLAKKEGYPSEDYEDEVLNVFRTTLVTHIKRNLQFFYSSKNAASVDCLLLAGGTVTTPKLVETLREEVDIDLVILANPFENMSIGSKVDKQILEKNASSLMMTVGLALWGVVK